MFGYSGVGFAIKYTQFIKVYNILKKIKNKEKKKNYVYISYAYQYIFLF